MGGEIVRSNFGPYRTTGQNRSAIWASQRRSPSDDGGRDPADPSPRARETRKTQSKIHAGNPNAGRARKNGRHQGSPHHGPRRRCRSYTADVERVCNSSISSETKRRRNDFHWHGTSTATRWQQTWSSGTLQKDGKQSSDYARAT